MGVSVRILNPSTQEVEPAVSPEFQASQNYPVKPCPKII